jgi:hypothetical protein
MRIMYCPIVGMSRHPPTLRARGERSILRPRMSLQHTPQYDMVVAAARAAHAQATDVSAPRAPDQGNSTGSGSW